MLKQNGVVYALLILMVISLTGCDLLQPLIEPTEPVNAWVGSWSLETIDGERLETQVPLPAPNVVVSTYSNRWTFRTDGTWNAEFLFEFTFNDGLDSASLIQGGQMNGTYELSGQEYRLRMQDGEGFFFETPDEDDTGTWEIVDDTLTLHSSDGSVVVFKSIPESQ